MSYEKLTPGYLGISEGDETINALVLCEDGDVYMIQVTAEEAEIIHQWSLGERLETLDDLIERFGAEHDMFFYDGCRIARDHIEKSIEDN